MSFGFSTNWTTLSSWPTSNTPNLVGSSTSNDPISELEHKLEDSNELVLGPIKTESGFKYEVQIKLSKDVNYIKFINLFKSLNKIELTRVRYI